MSEPTRRKYVSLSEDELCSQLYGVDNDIEVTYNYKFIVWVGGVGDQFSNLLDAEIAVKKWKSKGYKDVVIERTGVRNG